MKVADALTGVTHLFLDTAPVIFLIERNVQYLSTLTPIFSLIDKGELSGVASPVTLAETLIHPIRLGLTHVASNLTTLLTASSNILFPVIGASSAQRAAQLRAYYNLALSDALQCAVALENGCQAVLTNDKGLRRVSELRVIIVEDLEL